MNKYSMFYNYHIIGDILMIVFNHKEKPTHHTKNGDVVGVYHNDEIILDDQVMENDKLLSYISSHQDYKISGDAKHLGIKHEEVDVIANLAKAENDKNLVNDIFALKPKYLKEIK